MKAPFWLSMLTAVMLCMVTRAPCQQTLWNQTFNTQDALDAWLPNSDLTGMRIENGTLHCQGTGIDPLMVCKTPLRLAANAFQAVEFRLKADHDGTVQIFWSGTTTGKYGGFSGEKRTEVPIRGDGQFHTYRAFPFWQKEGRIVQLRFDPYQGARFEIAYIQVVQLPQPALADHPTLVSLQGVSVQNNKLGQVLTQTAPGGITACAVPNIDAETNTVVSVRILSNSATAASLVFGTTDSFGLHQQHFSVIADGQGHWYNLDMLNAAAWHGKICVVGIQPGSHPGDSLAIQELQIGSKPVGPADIRIVRFLVEETLPRAGMPVHLLARITNVGAQPASLHDVVAKTAGGLRITAPVKTGSTAPLKFGEERELHFTAIPSHVGECLAALTVGSTHASIKFRATLRPAVRANYAPEPVPLKQTTGVQVGAYYFPGWKSSGQWSPITRFPERRPALGWYREGSPTIIDWQIKWALEHGIGFFAYDWYWQQGAQQLDHSLRDGLFKSRYEKLFKFCLLWANHNAPGSSSAADCLAAAKFWKSNYFCRSSYLRVNGKPVVIIFSPYRFREDMGSKGVKEAFAAIRSELADSGGIELIACVNSAADAKLAEQEGYDAVSCYNWPSIGMHGAENAAPYADLLPAYVRQWQTVLESCSLPLLPPLSGGWDNRPWAGDAAMVRTDRTPALFGAHVQDGITFIRQHPGRTIPILLAEAWNEWGEGSYVEPQQQYAFGYLDAIRAVLAPGKQHTDLTPADVGSAVPQIDFGDLTSSTWVFAQGLAGWENTMQLANLQVKNGVLSAQTTGSDPAFFGPPMQLDAGAKSMFVIRYRATASTPPAAGGDLAQLFWQTRTAPESEATSVRFPLEVDGNWHVAKVDLGRNRRWRGTITRLRFDPCERAGVQLEISKIAVSAQ